MNVTRFLYLLCIVFVGVTSTRDTLDLNSPRKLNTFWNWYHLCNELPCYTNTTNYTSTTALTADKIKQTVQEFCKIQKDIIAQEELWLGHPIDLDRLDKDVNNFAPYVQKLVVQPGSTIAFHGDLHGDVHSLNEYVVSLQQQGYLDPHDPFRITDPNFYMIFLGDYVDRGWYGAEVIYTILRLKLANPDKVWLVRGNHEDASICTHYGFRTELSCKFKDKSEELFNLISRMYELLPVALYLGSGDGKQRDYLLCCHGGLEIGFNPDALLSAQDETVFTLLGTLFREKQINLLPDTLQNPIKEIVPEQYCHNYVPQAPTDVQGTLGFMWNDFIVDENIVVGFTWGRGWQLGKQLTKHILSHQSGPNYKVRGVMRAHQHSPSPTVPMMKRILNTDKKSVCDDAGVGKLWIPAERDQTVTGTLWDGIVCTFLVSPCTPYGYGAHFDYDAFGLLTTAHRYQDWKLAVQRVDMKPYMKR